MRTFCPDIGSGHMRACGSPAARRIHLDTFHFYKGLRDMLVWQLSCPMYAWRVRL